MFALGSGIDISYDMNVFFDEMRVASTNVHTDHAAPIQPALINAQHSFAAADAH
jgi:hypothetical protein